MKNKFIKISIVILVLIFICLYVSYYTSEKVKHDYFINTVKYDMIILKLLEDNRTHGAKILLSGGVNRIFVAAMNDNDIEKYSEFCDYLTQENFIMIKQYDLNLSDENIYSSHSKKYIQKEIGFRKLREKFYKYCQNKEK